MTHVEFAAVMGKTMSDFEQYQATLLSILDERWKPGRHKKQLRAVISFGVEKNGAIAWAKVRDASGDKDHDEAALQFVKGLAPFPQPPDSISSKTIFAFNFDSNYGGDQPAGVPRPSPRPKSSSNQTEIQAIAIFESEE
jgi:TonB family protein